MLAVCARVQHGDTTEPLTPQLLARIREVTAAQNGEGLRVVAVAAKEMPPAKEVYAVADESGMTLIGLDTPLQSVVVGVVLVFAVWLDTLYRRRAK